MTFNPQDHLSKYKGKDYLEVKWRLVWFREENPKGRIITKVLSIEPALVRASIYDNEGHFLASAHGTAKDTGNAVWSGRSIEKAETAAIGRALGHAGFGTQFTEDDEDEDSPVDSPVDRTPAQPKAVAPMSKVAQTLGSGDKPRRIGEEKPRPSWDDSKVLETLRNWCLSHKEIKSDTDIAKLALIKNFTDVAEWRKAYPTPDDAYRFIKLTLKAPETKAS